MRETDELHERLEDSANRYSNDGEVPVNFAGGAPSASPQGYVNINPSVNEDAGFDVSGANDLRMLRADTAHEVAHINYSVLTGKQDFMREYSGVEKLAGMVCNILEDRFVDTRVKQEYPGMRQTYALQESLMMDDDDNFPALGDVDGVVDEAVAGFVQLSSFGWVKGYDEASEPVRRFLARQKPRIETISEEFDPDERERLMHKTMQDFEEIIPQNKQDEANEAASEGEKASGNSGRQASNPEQQSETEPPEPEDVQFQLDMDPEAEQEPEEPEDEQAESEAEAEAEAEGEGEGEDEDGEGESEGEGEAEGEQVTGEQEEEDEDIDEEMDELDEKTEMTPAENANEENDIEIDTDVEEATEADKRRFERLQDEIEGKDTDMEERMKERDGRVENNHPSYPKEQIRKTGERDNVYGDVREAFREIASDDGEHLATEGHRLDVRNVVQHAAGNKSINRFYRREEQTETGDRAVNVTLDISGSMNGSGIKNAKVAIAALAMACDEIGDTFCANTYTTRFNHGNSAPEDMLTWLVTAPDEEFEWDHLDGIVPQGYDPTCWGVDDGRDILSECRKTDKIMFVITDGKAQINYAGENSDSLEITENDPLVDARMAVNKARQEGIKVVGFGLGGIDEAALEATFGSDGYVVSSSDTLAEDLIEQYRRSLSTQQQGGRW